MSAPGAGTGFGGPIIDITARWVDKLTEGALKSVDDVVNKLYELDGAFAENTTAIGSNLNIQRAWGQTFAENTVMVRTFTNVLGTLSRIVRQLVGMYTQWTFWQIRLSSYTHMLRTAQRRLTDVVRRYDRHKRDVSIRLMMEEIRYAKELIKSHIDYRSSLVGLRTAYNQNAMNQIRFGENSEEAMKSEIALEAQMYKTAEALKRQGYSAEEAALMMDNTRGALMYAASEAKGLDGVLQDVFQSEEEHGSIMSVNEEHLMRQAALTDDLASSQVEYAEDMAAAMDDIENSELKVKLATGETRVMMLGFAVQLVGMSGLVLNLAKDMALLSLLQGSLGAETLFATSAFASMRKLLTGSTLTMAGVKGALGGIAGALGGVLSTIVSIAAPILALIALIAGVVFILKSMYQRFQWFHDLVNNIVAGIGNLFGTLMGGFKWVGNVFDKIFGVIGGTGQAEDMGESFGEAWNRGVESGMGDLTTDDIPFFNPPEGMIPRRGPGAIGSGTEDISGLTQYNEEPGKLGSGFYDMFIADFTKMNEQWQGHLGSLNSTAEEELNQITIMSGDAARTAETLERVSTQLSEYGEMSRAFAMTFGDINISIVGDGSGGTRFASWEEMQASARIAEDLKNTLELELSQVE